MLANRVRELVDLVYEAQDSACIGLDDVGIDSSTSIRKVIRQHERVVLLFDNISNPIRTTSRCPSGEGRVAEWVCSGGLCTVGVEACLGV